LRHAFRIIHCDHRDAIGDWRGDFLETRRLEEEQEHEGDAEEAEEGEREIPGGREARAGATVDSDREGGEDEPEEDYRADGENRIEHQIGLRDDRKGHAAIRFAYSGRFPQRKIDQVRGITPSRMRVSLRAA
jgi:hypothetical protein